jgi:hypothetical protein
MDRRLRAPEPDLAGVHDSAHKINGFARAALNSCLDVITWLAPEEEVAISVGEGARECLSLLTTSLTFRGYAVRNEVGSADGRVRRSAIRNVLTAALIHMTDETPSPAELTLTAHEGSAATVLTLTLRPTDGDAGFPAEASYRRIDQADLEALAAAESVELARDGAQRLRLSIPRGGTSRA